MSASSAFWGVSSGSARASRTGVTSDMVRSADVLLHHVRIARMRLRRIAAELAQRAALAQQIPALIELGLHLREALAFLGRELATLEQAVLFADEVLDMREYGCVLFRLDHGCSSGIDTNIGRSPRKIKIASAASPTLQP